MILGLEVWTDLSSLQECQGYLEASDLGFKGQKLWLGSFEQLKLVLLNFFSSLVLETKSSCLGQSGALPESVLVCRPLPPPW